MNDEGILQKVFALGNSYWLTRFVILRLLGFVYAVAFLVAAQQLVPLIGERGLTPATHFLNAIQTQLGLRMDGVMQVPTLFWFGISDSGLSIFAWVGFGLSLVVLCGYANAILLAVLWAMYMSIVHIGQIWYGYGWEIQLLETGFLSIFLCPLLDARPFPKCRPPILVIWLFRWLGFRIMIGAGLIKLRGDPCWRDLTCLYYHYETQPIPNPLSRTFHFMPHWSHKAGVLYNHTSELVAPWFAFWPRLGRHLAGAIMLVFQCILILSGNLSFLNWLTIVPFLACFDDTFLRHFLPRALVQRAERAADESQPSRINNAIAIALSLLVVYLSVAPVLNLFSGRQLMNSSYDPLDLVNTYGAFGTVGRERDEIIFEGTDDAIITGDTKWKEYELKPSQVIQIGGRRSSRRISRASIGKSGSQRWRHPVSTRGRCILSGNFSTTIAAHSRCWRTIPFPMAPLITFARDFIVISSLRLARKNGGNANQSANGCPRFQWTIYGFGGCSKRWIGWIKWNIDL